MDGHGQDGAHPERDFINDSKCAVARPDFLHQVGLSFGHLQQFAGRKHQLDVGDIRSHLPELARHGRVLRARTSRATCGEIADFSINIKLQSPGFQSLCNINVKRPALHGHSVGSDV